MARGGEATGPSENGSDGGLVKRNVTVGGLRTSIKLEPEMWDALKEVCKREGVTVSAMCTAINRQKPEATALASAIRVHLVRYFRASSTEEGHTAAGHGRQCSGVSVRTR